MTHYSPFANGRIVCSPVFPIPGELSPCAATAHLEDVDCERCLTATISIRCEIPDHHPIPTQRELRPTWRELHSLIRRIANEL